MDTICSENTLRFVRSLPHRERVPFAQKFTVDDAQGTLLSSIVLIYIKLWICWKNCSCLIHESARPLTKLCSTRTLKPITIPQTKCVPAVKFNSLICTAHGAVVV
jgi:hypothetical protein